MIVRRPLSRLNPTTISFDGDGTLWDFEQAMRRALASTLAELVRLAPEAESRQLTVDRMIAIRDEVAQGLEGQRYRLEDIRLKAFEVTLTSVGIHDVALARELNAFYHTHRFHYLKLYPDVTPSLNALARRFRLGLLSNGNTDPERCGLENRFGFVLFAQDCGFEKPDRRIFEQALELAQCTSDQMVHVGDSLQSDVLGARNAGVASAWLNRRGTANDTEIIPDIEIASLAELDELLGRA